MTKNSTAILDDDENICEACTTEYGEPEVHCYRQRGRKCSLKEQEIAVNNLYYSKDWGSIDEE